MKYNSENKTKSRKQKIHSAILNAMIGFSMLFILAVTGYNIMSISSFYLMIRDLESYKKVSQKHQNNIKAETSIPKKVASSNHSNEHPKSIQEITAIKIEYVSVENDETANESEPIEKYQYVNNGYDIVEIQQLKEALPGNMMVPGNKSEMERNVIYADMKEQYKLQDLIQNDQATDDERQRYYDLQAKRFEDEIELIQYCKEKLSHFSHNEHIYHDLCADITEYGDEVIEADEKSLDNLRNQLL